MMHLFISLLTAALIVPLPAQDEPQPRSFEKLFAILDRFETSDIGTVPFVRVATGDWTQHDADPPRKRYICGFLLRHSGQRFTVLRFDMSKATFERTVEGTPELDRVAFEILDFADCAKAQVESVPGTEPAHDTCWSPGKTSYLRPDNIWDLRARAVLLARYCAKRGLTSAAEAI